MPTFVPPVDQTNPAILPDTRGAQFDLFKYYKPRNVGRNVWKLTDGTYTETQPSNWNPDHPSDPYLTTWYNDSPTYFLPAQIVDRVYYGGHSYQITSAEASALTAAGYGSYVT